MRKSVWQRERVSECGRELQTLNSKLNNVEGLGVCGSVRGSRVKFKFRVQGFRVHLNGVLLRVRVVLFFVHVR